MMFTKKSGISRDIVLEIFTRHCKNEASLLLASVERIAKAYCDGSDGRPAYDAVISRPRLSFDAGRRSFASKSLLDAHCYAIALATGLGAVRHIDPSSQRTVMVWGIKKLIVEEDVGAEFAGRAPNPSPRPGIHVSYTPGTFVGGLPSPQQKLVQAYEGIAAPAGRAALLAVACRLVEPTTGVALAVYERRDFGNGFTGMNILGYRAPEPDELDEWNTDIEIQDPAAVLAPIPASLRADLIESIKRVDPFWPRFCRRHFLTCSGSPRRRWYSQWE